MELNLKNKRILITGSSRGIGFGIAESFLEEGAKVFLCARNSDHLNRAKKSLTEKFKPDFVESFACDVMDPESLEKLTSQLSSKWGGLDVLVCNVGSGAGSREPIADPDEFNRLMELNFTSAVNTTRVFYDMLRESVGNIVFISSIAGLEDIGAPGAYSAAKSALNAFAKSLARRFAESKVRVNTIAPGNIIFPGGSWDRKKDADPAMIDLMLKSKVPMQDFGSPSEVGALCVFICSEKARFVNGSLITIDGGQTVKF